MAVKQNLRSPNRGLLARGHAQAVRPRRGVEGLRPLVVEGEGIGGVEAGEQGDARRRN
jgi:hypothetical protein